MSKISYTPVQNATDQSQSVLRTLRRWKDSPQAVWLISKTRGTRGSTVLFVFIVWLVITIVEVLIRGLFAPKTRIGIERKPYKKEPSMLRFIKTTIKLTMGAFIALAVTLFLAFATIIILLIQLIAHSA